MEANYTSAPPEVWEDLGEEARMAQIGEMRAALRALAAMEPAQGMICAAEVMREAYDAEVERWEIRHTILRPSLEVHHIRRCKGDPFDSDPETGWELKCSSPTFDEADEEYKTLSRLAGHRAALRAFAAMEPTQRMENAYVTVGRSIGKDRAWADEPYAPTRSYIFAAAEEGEDKANG
jgi:hypothetical protein